MRVANAPVSWGVMEFDLEGDRSSFAQVLDEIRATGYDGTELGDWGFLPTNAARLREELASRQLALVGGFVPVPLSRPEGLAAGEGPAVQVARLMAEAAGDAPILILSDDNGRDELRTRRAGRVRPKDGLDEARWRRLAETSESIADQVCRETGLKTALHHHCAGFVEAPWEIETFLSKTSPDRIGLCLDTGHARFGGGDPAAIARKHGDRIRHVHFKDCDPTVAARSRAEGMGYFDSVRQGVFCELGRGDVDFPGVLAALRDTAYDGWIVVEQDVLPGTGSPNQSAARNRAYLRRLDL